MTKNPTTVVFDIGNVLVAWDPRNLYRRFFEGEEERMEWFLTNICTPAWNIEQDRGRSFADAVEILVREHPPEWHPMIRAFDEHWHETISGPIAGSVDILKALKHNRVPVYAITNWNQDKFREALQRFDFLNIFEGIVVSGDERLLKPGREIFDLFFTRYGVTPETAVFIDDSLRNVEGARAAGMQAIHFTSPEALGRDLRAMGFSV
ncbi:HAD family hydrolase [Taklimakanibacter lacteus]|uniref:HAD family hydrolase n=1 Tax=Taklimakanibacter lacteus TaxID=2268456 RepID=UPI000E66FB0D